MAMSSVTEWGHSVEKLRWVIEKTKSVKEVKQTHAYVVRRGLDEHPILRLKLQRSYSSLHRPDLSLSLFRITHSPNIFLFTSIIHSHPNHALPLFSLLLSSSISPNSFALSAALKFSPLRPGTVLHSLALKLSLDSDPFVRTALLNLYSRAGDVSSAHHLFDTMPHRSIVSSTAMMACYARHGHLPLARALFDALGPGDRDVVCWNVMIDGYAQHGSPREALLLFRQILESQVRPEAAAVVSALSACAQIGAEESGRWIHTYIEDERNGIRVGVRVGTALIDMYCKCGSLGDARRVFDSIQGKDVVVWNSMISGYAMHGLSREALRLFDEMQEEGHRPTDITFIAVLGACAHSGLVVEGRRFFQLMEDEFRIEPKIEHYGCFVNLLSRAGLVEEAYGIVKSMDIEPDPVLWGTILGACRVHGKAALGEEIAKLLVAQGVANSGTYVLLSNIYAANGDWDGVAKVRSLMRESGVSKEPGCTSIEVNNKVHEFLAGDKRHPKSRDIYGMLEEINGWLKDSGYSPQTDVVLHDLGERQKQQSLEVHSEKLAIAFGLISTKSGATIKVVKNLRVCEDCHAVTKLVSKITGRRIVMRDRNRFHHFENGSCSCGDYW